MSYRYGLGALTVLALASCGKETTPITITGSSTVYPFTKAVAEHLVETSKDIATPRIEEIGTVSGVVTFCNSPDVPDILDASRRMTRKEFDICRGNNVGNILEVPIGLDGIALAESSQGPKIAVTVEDLYKALAANPMGQPNTSKTWRDVNPKLPPIPIKVLGPPATSGTRDSFAALILEAGCLKAMPAAAELRSAADPAKFENACRSIRGDGAYETAGENDNAIVTALEGNKDALGLFGYSYLEQNAARLRGVPIDGVAPDASTIGRGEYKGARTLYLYVKKARMAKNPAIQAFLDAYVGMWGINGPLTKRGLIAQSSNSASAAADIVKNGTPLSADDLY